MLLKESMETGSRNELSCSECKQKLMLGWCLCVCVKDTSPKNERILNQVSSRVTVSSDERDWVNKGK